MLWHEILLIVFYSVLTLTLITLKLFKIGKRRRGVVKMLTSVSFLAVGVYGCVAQGGGISIILSVGLFFACLGDLCLVFMDRRSYFVCGIIFFSLCSLLLCVYSVLVYGWYWWSVVFFLVVTLANILCQKFNVYDYGSVKWELNVYFVLVSACGSLGLTLFCQGIANIPMFLFGLGCFLYLASDICLGLYEFKFRNVVVDAINSALYFPGMFLVAMSLIL